MDSTQAWFCRDLWVDAAKDGGVRTRKQGKVGPWGPSEEEKERQEEQKQQSSTAAELFTTTTTTSEAEESTLGSDEAFKDEQKKEKDETIEDDLPNKNDEPVAQPAPGPDAKPRLRRRQEGAAAGEAEANAVAHQRPDAQHKGDGTPDGDSDANAGSDYDAMSDESDQSPPPLDIPSSNRWAVPNSDFNPARILVNPRCVTTYAGVSHAQLSLDLFGPDKDDDAPEYARTGGKYVLEDWEGAPDSFVCQEQK